MSSVPRPPVHRIILLQLGLTLLAGAIAALHSQVAAGSALLGGIACAAPNAYFVWRAFRFRGARYAGKVAAEFYQGEAWKFILTGLMFAVIFSQNWPLNYFALFAGFVTVQLGHLFSAKIANF